MFSRTLLAFSILCATACAAETTTDTSADGTDSLRNRDVAGQWRSTTCEAYPDGQGGQSFLTRDFTLTEETWSLTVGIFGDQDCSYPLFSAQIDGPFQLIQPSAQVADAVDGDFSFSSIVWTAHDPAMVDVFAGAGCGTEAWEVGVPQDVSETGCIGVAQPIEACPTEHDVVALKNGLLFFGERITDMCVPDGRPAALSAYGLQASE